MVVDKLPRQWLLEGMEDLDNPGTAGQFILLPQSSDNPQNISEGVVIGALQSCTKEPDEGITDVLRVVSVLWWQDELDSCPLGCLK